MRAKGGYVYVVTNKAKSVLYIGVTSNLSARITQHRSGEGSAFTKRYNCIYLIYYRFFDTIVEAIENDKKMKRWNRAWKDKRITEFNPQWTDLYNEIEDFN
jgi:putative endonuclease